MVKKETLPEKQSYEDVKQELVQELSNFSNGTPTELAKIMVRYRDAMVQTAVYKFEASVEDKKRQLELGELVDQFFQRIKLNG